MNEALELPLLAFKRAAWAGGGWVGVGVGSSLVGCGGYSSSPPSTCFPPAHIPPHTQVRVFVFMLHGQQRPLPASHVNGERSCSTTWDEADEEAGAPLNPNGC